MVAQKQIEGLSLILMTIALSLATFMQVLDSTISNIAMPVIASNLGVSNSQGIWVITSFGIANAISIPITGCLAKYIGEVKLFTWSTTLFALFSWICGISKSLEILIISRIFQGFVAGPLIPLSQSLLLRNYPPEKHGIALSIWAMTVIIAPICGPIMGGWISDNHYWGWIFFINIPVAFVVIILTLYTLKIKETKNEDSSFDIIGLILLLISIGILEIIINRGKEFNFLESINIITLIIADIIVIGLLLVWELANNSPIIDFSLFKILNFTIGSLAISLAYMIYFGTTVLFPQLLQEVYGYTAIWAGMALSPIGIMPIILSPIIGRFAHKLDMRWLVTLSFVIYSICFYWRAYTFGIEMDFKTAAWPQFFQGFAIAFFFMPLTTIILSNLPPERLAAASSLSNLIRTLSGSIGTSIISNICIYRKFLHFHYFSKSINTSNFSLLKIYDQLQSIGMSNKQIIDYIQNMLFKQSFIISVNEIFWMSANVFIFLIILIWLTRPPFLKKS